MYVTAFNSTDRPLTVDAEGRSIGGGEWGTVETTDEAAKALLEEGLLVKIDPPKGKGAEIADGAREAFERTDRIAALAKTLEGLDKEPLEALAEEHAPELVGQNKPALVAGLAARGVEVDAAAVTPERAE